MRNKHYLMVFIGLLALIVLTASSVDAIAPLAEFEASSTSGYVPHTVTFNDKSTGIPTSWFWDFGDGYTSTEQNPIHTYTKRGHYTVTLTVTNAEGSDSIIKKNYIDIDKLPKKKKISH